MNLRQLSRWSIGGALVGVVVIALLTAHVAQSFLRHSENMRQLDRLQHGVAELGVEIGRISDLSATPAVFENAHRELATIHSTLAKMDKSLSTEARGHVREMQEVLDQLEEGYRASLQSDPVRINLSALAPDIHADLLQLRAMDFELRLIEADLHETQHRILDGKLIATFSLFVAVVLVLASSAIFAFLLLHKRIHGPMQALLAGIRSSGQGDYAHRLHIAGHDEFSELGLEFNRMLASLQAREEENEQYRTGLDRSLQERTEAAREARRQSAMLDKRVKELSCINRVTNILDDAHRPFSSILQEAVDAIPAGWQYPEFTVACVEVDGETYFSGGEPPQEATVARMQEHIIASDRRVGNVEVGYLIEYPLADEGPFLAEERDLLHLIADKIGHCLEQRLVARTLRELAYEDPLTGLPSSTGFAKRLQEYLRSETRSQIDADAEDWLILLNLYHLNDVNQSFGYECGDALLRAVATRLQAAVGTAGEVGRVAGDHFALRIRHPANASPATVMSWVDGLFEQPFCAGEHVIPMSMTAGLARIDAQVVEGSEVLRRAQLAFHTARHQRPASWVAHDGTLDREAGNRIRLSRDIKQAVEDEQFVLHYQPQVRLDTGHIAACEALIRWQHPDRGLLLPDAFISAAEHSRAILPIGEWVIHQACRQLRQWHDADAALAGARVAVNVSMAQFTDSNVADTVERAVEQSGIPAEFLSLELTESLFEREPGTVLSQMKRLRELGVRLVLDDFGTGYSSLSHLDRYPFDEIKIDRMFVRQVSEHPYREEIVRMIVRAAAILGCELVAEGVETAVQRDRLVELGCRTGQGFLFSRAVSAEEFSVMLANGKPLTGTSASVPRRAP